MFEGIPDRHFGSMGARLGIPRTWRQYMGCRFVSRCLVLTALFGHGFGPCEGCRLVQEGRRIHKKQIPATSAARPIKMAVSYHWNVQNRLSG